MCKGSGKHSSSRFSTYLVSVAKLGAGVVGRDKSTKSISSSVCPSTPAGTCTAPEHVEVPGDNLSWAVCQMPWQILLSFRPSKPYRWLSVVMGLQCTSFASFCLHDSSAVS
jgi:hypothetical protein